MSNNNTSKEKCLCGAVGDGAGALVVEHHTSEAPITEGAAMARFRNPDPHLSIVYAIEEDDIDKWAGPHQGTWLDENEITSNKWRLVYRWYPVCLYDNNYDCV
jgi:3-oxoacyl-[acyl-carrier-protein] synthase III